jgi:hypothetical protein
VSHWLTSLLYCLLLALFFALFSLFWILAISSHLSVVGLGRYFCLLSPTCTAVIHGWLLWETTPIALTTIVAFVVIGERALLLSRGVAAAWGLLANSHAELDVCKLVLHCN